MEAQERERLSRESGGQWGVGEEGQGLAGHRRINSGGGGSDSSKARLFGSKHRGQGQAEPDHVDKVNCPACLCYILQLACFILCNLLVMKKKNPLQSVGKKR